MTSFLFPQLDAPDFTADGFRQLINKLNRARILVWGRDLLAMVLQFSLESFTRRKAAPEDNVGFDDLPTNWVWLADDAGFQHGRMFEQCAFDFKWSDPVRRAFDHVVAAACEPVITGCIAPG